MHKNATKCNETLSKWCKNKHGASKIIDTFETYQIPPKLGDAWIPKVLVTIGKETHHAILDLGSSVSILSKELYELLELQHI
jgi:hypothetical protein